MGQAATYWLYAWAATFRAKRLRRPTFAWALILSLYAGAGIPLSWAATEVEQREAYKRAVASIRAGQFQQHERYAKQLTQYLLAPYLKYHRLNARLRSASDRDVLAFLEQYDLPVTPILRQRWLKSVGRSRRWQTLLDHYPGRGDAELFCYYLRALYGTGERERALAATAGAWIKSSSQPKACDPLFAVWRNSDFFSEDVVWQRLGLALRDNEVTLARYLQRYLSVRADAAQRYYDVHVRPQRLRRVNQYAVDKPLHRELVQHGLVRLARRDPALAASLWPQYQNRLSFSAAERAQTQERLMLALAKEGQFPAVESRAGIQSQDVIAKIAEYAAQTQNWSEVIYWTERLDDERRNEAGAQYFLARALEASTGDQARARLTYQALAKRRHYYGFWAAQRLGLSGVLNEQPVQASAAVIAKVATQPNIRRSLELFAVDDLLNARREWFAGLSKIGQSEQIAAAQLALNNGLTQLAIQTANRADAHDALTLRFPTAFAPQFRQAALKTSLPAPLLLAVSRQESALDHQARSHANARGLMQLLPSTATLVARRSLLPSPSLSDLYDPGKNIALGSHHLAWLLARYDDQLPPAIAAYNAGEHRADRWLKDQAGLPMDIWIERIPFNETRNYVKNVLAFQHVYGQLLNQPLPFLPHQQLVVRE